MPQDLARQLKAIRDTLVDDVLSARRDDLAPWAVETLQEAAGALWRVMDGLCGAACAQCGGEVEANTTGRPRAYCGRACQQAAYRDRRASVSG
jgi:formamidopyrimidine-DNA glycosylase